MSIENRTAGRPDWKNKEIRPQIRGIRNYLLLIYRNIEKVTIMEKRLCELLEIALRNHVTDIHFSLVNNVTKIEMRVNGVMRQVKSRPEDTEFLRYLMYRANLDLSDIMMPQTGRFEAEASEKKLALRFALVSSYQITSGVLRILNNHEALTSSMLSTDPMQQEWFSDICRHRSGLYIFSGPTGSGKTTTLYTILNEVKGKKIYTLEDPVEVYSEKYVQLSVNDRQNLSYADGIRQLMRHDPDIVMIGEIRDSAAAEMAVRTALTGHLVVTTLHSDSCTNAIGRMIDLGVKSYQLNDVLYGVSCQRLYDCLMGGKIGVYEIMNRKEVIHYFKNHKTSDQFRKLSEKIVEAAEHGYIEIRQAYQDLD